MTIITLDSSINKEIKVNGQKLETVTSLKYLGSVVSDMIAQMTAALTRLKPVWNDRSISLSSKIWHMLPCHIHLPVCLWIMDPHSRVAKKNKTLEMRCYGKIIFASHTKTMLPTKGSLCRDPAGNRTNRRPDHPKKMQTEVLWTCLLFIRPGQNHLARYSERAKKRQGRQQKRWEDNIKEWTGWSLPSPRGQRRTEKNRGNWWWSHLWCPSDPRG